MRLNTCAAWLAAARLLACCAAAVGEQATVTTVASPQQLQLALAQGSDHVEVLQHLDLTELQDSGASQLSSSSPDLFRPFPSTRSITVCTAEHAHCHVLQRARIARCAAAHASCAASYAVCSQRFPYQSWCVLMHCARFAWRRNARRILSARCARTPHRPLLPTHALHPLNRAARLQGNCSAAALPAWAAAVPLTAPLAGAQCLLRVPFQLFYWHDSPSTTWLHSLSIVFYSIGPASAQATLLYWAPRKSSRLWITKTAWQGDGTMQKRGMYLGAAAYVAGARCWNCATAGVRTPVIGTPVIGHDAVALSLSERACCAECDGL